MTDLTTPRVRRVLLGHFAGAHGIRGAVLVKSYTAEPEDIASYGALEDEAGQRSFEIEIEGATGKGLIARVAGISDRTAAETLKGVALYVPRDRLPEPEDGEFYHCDLVGLAAVDEAGQALGAVVEVLNYGAGDILEIKAPGKAKTVLLPMTAQVVVRVDLAAGRIVLSPPDEVIAEGEGSEGDGGTQD